MSRVQAKGKSMSEGKINCFKFKDEQKTWKLTQSQAKLKQFSSQTAKKSTEFNFLFTIFRFEERKEIYANACVVQPPIKAPLTSFP